MIGEIFRGLVAGMIGERLFGRWAKKHPRLTLLICVPPLVAVAVLATLQIIRS